MNETPKKYRTKYGWLFILIFAAFTVFPIVILINGSSGPLIFFGAIDILILYPLLYTVYTFEDKCLRIRSGLIVFSRIPYESIERFWETHNPLSSAALSLDRIAIVDHRLNFRDLTLISPINKEEFMLELEKRTGKKRGK